MPSFGDVERYWSSVLSKIRNIFVSNFIELQEGGKADLSGIERIISILVSNSCENSQMSRFHCFETS